MVVLVEDGVTLGLADLLEDDLFGHLGGDAAKWGGVFVEAEFAADLDFRSEFACLVKGELIDVVFNLLGCFYYGLVDIGANLTGLAIHLGAHVLLGLVVFARGEGNGILNGADDDAGFDSFVAAQGLN